LYGDGPTVPKFFVILTNFCHSERSEESAFLSAGTKDSAMRHKVAGWKLGRNTSHRRSLLRNLVTSLIIEERIETTIPKAKAMRPQVEKMITLGKRGDLAARRQALAYLMTSAAVDKLFDTIGPRFGDRNGGYLRIVRTGWRKGDGADNAFVELLGSEKVLDEKRQKRGEARAKRAAETKRAMEEAEQGVEHPAPGAEGEDKIK
jgi:large subunit ribosomal protein L17